MNDYLTTGQTAQILGTSDRYVVGLCDKKLLPCHTLPGSNRRRIAVGDLAELMRRSNIPLNRISQYFMGKYPDRTVLVAMSDAILAETIAARMNESGEFVADSCSTSVSVGFRVITPARAYVVYDTDLVPCDELHDLVSLMLDDIPILIAVGSVQTQANVDSMLKMGYMQRFLRRPVDSDIIMRTIKEIQNDS